MVEDRSVLREVAWQQVFPSLSLCSAWRVAIGMRPLVLAALGLVVTIAGWSLIDYAFNADAGWQVERGARIVEPNEVAPGVDFDGAWDRGPAAIVQQSPIGAAWAHLSRPFRLALSEHADWKFFLYLALSAVWTLAVWAFFGGAITRLAAIELAREEKPSWKQVLSYARSKWASYFIAPLYPLFGVLLATLPIAILGLFMRAGGAGAMFVALLWPIALFASFVMSVLLLGLFFGWPLMWPTISAEGTDSFDALSRSYAYSLQRPLRYFWYVLVAAVIGLLAWIIVSLFAGLVIHMAAWAASWGAGTVRAMDILENRELEHLAGKAGDLIRFWNGIVALLATGFVFSYFFVAMQAIYFLLRYHIDATEMDEVFLGEEEAYDLPPLTTDAAGVPSVADAPPTTTEG